jgi:hypothetical protein
MKYMRKIAVAALAGAVASSVVMAKRDVIYKITHVMSRKRTLIQLERWYQSHLTYIDKHSVVEAERYINAQREHLLHLAKQKGYFGSRADGFLKRVADDACQVIVADRKAQVTKKYANYLYDIDINHSRRVDGDTQMYLIQASNTAKKLREKGCHTDALFVSLPISSPY